MDLQARAEVFEQAIIAATQPLNGQMPRPWMTDLSDPLSAQVFIVGRNQARTYDAAALSHQRHLSALFNRNGESCRGLYAELSGRPSPTRLRTDSLRAMLQDAGVARILETNVICYSTPMSADLAKPTHAGGRDTGMEMFRMLLETIRPRVLIAHGVGTAKDLGKLLGAALPPIPAPPDAPASVEISGTLIILLNSLAPPAWKGMEKMRPQMKEAAAMAAAALRHAA